MFCYWFTRLLTVPQIHRATDAELRYFASRQVSKSAYSALPRKNKTRFMPIRHRCQPEPRHRISNNTSLRPFAPYSVCP
jgi:hypothetical protein